MTPLELAGALTLIWMLILRLFRRHVVGILAGGPAGRHSARDDALDGGVCHFRAPRLSTIH